MTEETVQRFSVGWRLQHLILALGVTGLAASGLAIRYYATPYGKFVLGMLGGISACGLFHRIFALTLGIATIWHIFMILFTREGHEDFLALMPEKGDKTRWLKAIHSKLTGGEYEAEWGRYTFGQKVQYWMVATGVLLMIATGSILLFGHRSIAFLPKWLVDTVRVVHGGQGVELMAFLILWHLYSTHFAPGRFPMARSWINGKITLSELKLYHKREFRKLFPNRPAE